MIRVELKKNGTLISTNAIYGDDTKVSIERESGEMYKRTKISGDFTFVREDFDAIYNGSLDDKYLLEIYNDDVLITKGGFTKVDCEFDVDNRICRPSLTQTDNYDRLLNGLNNEYDLVKLAPRRESVDLTKRPILQFYMLTDTKMTFVNGGMSYEVDCTEVDSPYDMNQYHFAKLSNWRAYRVESLEPTWAYLNGTYFGDASVEGSGYLAKFTRVTGGYSLRIVQSGGLYRYTFYNESTGQVVDSALYGEASEFDTDTINISTWASGSGVIRFRLTNQRRYMYARVVHDKPNDADSFDIPTEDMVENNLNFHYCVPLSNDVFIGDVMSKVIYSFELSDTPTKWGINGDGKYFLQPTLDAGGQYIPASSNVVPISFNLWSPMSFWIIFDAVVQSNMNAYLEKVTLRDAYPIGDAIKVLLHEIDPDLEFLETNGYSEFLYEPQNPVTSTMYSLYITPITNVKKTYYNEAARKGTITLEQIFNLLKCAFQCYWFLDGNKLRIEHISWFKKGGTYYDGVRVPDMDLTALKSPKNGKQIGFGQNTITYDSGRLTKRYEFSWAEECTEPFDGYAFNVRNEYCRVGATTKFTCNNFVTDVDYVMDAPNQISDDLFVLIAAYNEDGRMATNIVRASVADNTENFYMQNGELSYLYLANRRDQSLWIDDLSGNDIEMDVPCLNVLGTIPTRMVGVPLVPRGLKRAKMQKVVFPISLSNLTQDGLIRTSIGDGEIENSEVNLLSQSNNCDLIFDIQ